MGLSRRQLFRLGLGAWTASVAVWTACATQPAAPTPVAPATVAPAASTPTHLDIASSSATPSGLPLWTAEDAGLFAQNGLQVAIQTIVTGTNSLAALLSGQVQMSYSSATDAVVADATGADVVVLATLEPVYPYVFEAASDIRTPDDLRGKNLGTGAPGGSGDTATRAALKAMGLQPDSDVHLTVIQGGSAGVMAALVGHQVQGAALSPPQTTQVEAQGFHALYSLAEHKVPQAGSSLLAKRAWVQANHDVVQQVIDAQVQALALLRSNRATGLSIMEKYLQNSDDSQMGPAYDFYVNNVLPVYPHVRAELFTDALPGLTKQNPQVAQVDIASVLDDSFVASAEARKVGQ